MMLNNVRARHNPKSKLDKNLNSLKSKHSIVGLAAN